MTKKDFIKFAKMLNEWNQARLSGVEFPFDRCVSEITNLLAESNPRFDYEKFKKAVYEK